MARNMKDKQAQYDKCMAQSAQYKFQCPSRCLAHSLLQRLLKKLGEHHILALLVEPKILEEPDVRIEKIIQAQKNHKLNTPQPQKRLSSGYYNNTTKKPRNGIPQMPPPSARGFNLHTNGFSSSRSSSTASTSMLPSSRSTSFSSATSLPSLRSIAPFPPSTKMPQQPKPPKPSPSKSAKPCLISQVIDPAIIKKTKECQIGVSKIDFNIEKSEKEQKLCLNIHRYGNKKFNLFGLAFRDNSGRWQNTAANKLPDDRVVSVIIPLQNAASRLTIFSVWFQVNPNSPPVVGAPIMVDLFGAEFGLKHIASFEPDIVEID
uniref:Uncharacterized protein n=1 Tax=Panagrolaimus sp. ES5 TaxID=591445 RepID=A0AC34FDI9_9BILA